MKIPDSIGFGLGLGAVALVGVGVAAYYLYKNRDKFDPTSQNNFATQGASALVKGVSGGAAAGGEDSVGGVFARFKEWVTGENADIARPVTQAEIEAYRMKKKTEQEVPDPTQPIYVFGG